MKLWPFPKNQPAQPTQTLEPLLRPVSASDDDIKWAVKVIERGFEPALQKTIEILNQFLSKRRIRAAMEIKWYFDKLEEVKEHESSQS